MADSLNALAAQINAIAVSKGFWNSDRNFGEMIALMHSELSEALDEHRNGNSLVYEGIGKKPEGAAVELVDCLIRILDTLHAYDVDIDEVVRAKILYNMSRPYLHGKMY